MGANGKEVRSPGCGFGSGLGCLTDNICQSLDLKDNGGRR